MNTFWKQFETFHNCKYPDFIKRILNFCGIHEASFSDFDEKVINDIEKLVNKNKSVLKDSSYSLEEEFKFLYGHRLLLIKLPERY